MKLISIAFVGLLVFAHITGDLEAALARPLSLFRDEGGGTYGFWLFGLLLAAGLFLVVALLRLRWFFDAGVLIVGAVLLAVVMNTPSADLDHLLAAFLLLGYLYIYFAYVFYRAESSLLWVHLPVPWLLIFLTRQHSYGLWQKSLILYYLLAMNVQYHEIANWLRMPKGSESPALSPKPRRDAQPEQKRFTID